MKQIASTYTYNKATGAIVMTGVNIDRDQLLLIVNTTQNVTYYNFADSATKLAAFTQAANTSITLNSAVITAAATHANADALTIYYDNQSGTVNTYPVQGTSVSNSNFTSVTPSTQLVAVVAEREVLTVFNEGPGNLHISPGATCTTTAYQVRLASGDYWECPAGQLSLIHSAVFATTGTARVTQVS